MYGLKPVPFRVRLLQSVGLGILAAEKAPFRGLPESYKYTVCDALRGCRREWRDECLPYLPYLFEVDGRRGRTYPNQLFGAGGPALGLPRRRT